MRSISADRPCPRTAIEAELLSTYRVELLPLARVDRALRIRHRSAASLAVGLLEHPLRALFMLVNGFFGAMMLLLVVGTVLSLAFSIVGGVGNAMFGHDGAVADGRGRGPFARRAHRTMWRTP